MSYLFQIFCRNFWDSCTLVQNNLRFLVCLSVCSLPHFLTEIILTVDISSSGWPIFHILSWDIPYKCWYNSFYEFLYTGLKLLNSFCLSVFLFVTSLDSDRPSLATGEFFLVSGLNFKTSGLVYCEISCYSPWIVFVYLPLPVSEYRCSGSYLSFFSNEFGSHQTRFGGAST